MTRDVKKAIKWWFIATLIVGITNILTGCRVETHFVPVPSTAVVPLPESIQVNGAWQKQMALGSLGCDLQGQPMIFIKAEVYADSSVRHYVLLHEEAHIRQALAHSQGCRGLQEQYRRDGDFRWLIESEAYCAVWDVRKKDGTASKAIWNEILRIMGRYDTSLDLQGVADNLPCKYG